LIELGSYLIDNHADLSEIFGFNDDDPDRVLSLSKRLFTQGYCDSVLLKVKGEPRKLGKYPRLVCMVSSLDVTIDRMFHHNLVIHEKEQDCYKIGTATSLNITTPASTDRMTQEFRSHQPLVSTDVQGWEYTTDTYDMYCCAIKHLYSGGFLSIHMEEDKILFPDLTESPRGKVARIILARAFVSCFRIISTEEGSLLCSPPGLMSSGGYLTFSNNSFIRSFKTVQATLLSDVNLRAVDLHREDPPEGLFNFSCGDDNLNNSKPLFVSDLGYQRLGLVITDKLLQVNTFSFCSTHFETNNSYGESIDKFFAHAMFSKTALVDLIIALENNFRFHPKFSYYYDLLQRELS